MQDADMDSDLREATRELGSNFEADRCRHASVTETTIWVFTRISTPAKRGKRAIVTRGPQVAVIAYELGTRDKGPWRVTLMQNGQPWAQHYERGLARACALVKVHGVKVA